MNHTTIDIQRLLDFYKIEATPARISVLEIFVTKPAREFTYADIFAQVKNQKKLAVSNGTVTTTLALFKVRNLIREVLTSKHITPGRKRGRPERKFRYNKITQNDKAGEKGCGVYGNG